MQLEFSMVVTLATLALLTMRPQLAFEFIDRFIPAKKPEEKSWERLLMFKKGGGSAPSPDPAIGQAALKEAQLGEAWLAESQKQFAVANERQAAQDKIANEVTQQQLGASKQAQEWATADRDRYKNVYKPMQDDFIDTAKNWDSEARQQTVADEAKADVLTNAAQQRMSTQRSQAAMGVSPTSGRFAGINAAQDASTALSAAGAQNTARNQVRKEGVALRSDAINMGSGLAVNPATSLGLGVSAGSSAMGTTSGNNAQSAGNGQILNSGYQGAMNGYGQQASILNQQYGNTLNAWNAQQSANASATGGMMSGVGSVVGMGMVAF